MTKSDIQYSVYSGEVDGGDIAPIRLDEGKFEGTVFYFNRIELIPDEDVEDSESIKLKYDVTFHIAVKDGETVDSLTFDEELEFFQYSNAVLTDLLTNSIKAKEEELNDSV